MLSILSRLTTIILCLIFAAVANAATFIVTSTADSGAGTLRQALLDANANAGMDTIEFSIPGALPLSIALLTPLPTIEDPVIIDGATQSGIQINGSSLVNGAGLHIAAGGSGTEIRGLEVGYFPEDGILLEQTSGVSLTDNVVRSNLNGVHLIGSSNNDIGVSDSGNTVIDNAEVSILLESESHSNRITDNYVRGLGLAAPDWVLNRGILLWFGTNDNTVTLNRIFDQGNQGIGAGLNADGNEFSYNYIENNGREGIELCGDCFLEGLGATATDNIVSHNILVNNTHSYGGHPGDITLWAGANGNIIKDNHITGSDDGVGQGIDLQLFNSDNQILDNVVINAENGLRVISSAPFFILELDWDPGSNGNVIKGNEFRSNIYDGISVDTESWAAGTFYDNVILENTIINSGRHGIYIANPYGLGVVTDNWIHENSIQKVAGDGLILDSDVNENLVTENKFKQVRGNGVSIFGNDNQVTENNFIGVLGLDIDDQGVGNTTD